MSRADKTFWFCIVCAAVLLASCNRSKAKDLAVGKLHAGRRVMTEPTHTARASQAKSEAATVGGQRAVNFVSGDQSGTARKPDALGRANNTKPADIISDRLLDAISQIESSGNPTAIGDGGRARGLFQLHRAAWEDARSLETQSNVVAKSQLIGDYETGSIDPTRARLAARYYLTHLAARFQRATRRTPTPAELYAAWNIGFSGFQQRGFHLDRVPKTTKQAIKKLETML